MSQQDNFSGGFVLGAIVGGIMGGIIGSVVTSQRLAEEVEEKPELQNAKPKKRMRPSAEQNIELARRSLEDKIAQLNDAIDDVRQQLGNVNGRAVENDLPGARETMREE